LHSAVTQTVSVLHRHPVLSLVTGVYIAFIAWLTLTPQPVSPEDLALVQRVLDALHARGYLESLDFAQLEFLANIALFVPLGMFLMLLFGTRLWWLALAACFALTTFIEAAQRHIAGRVSDERDLVANGVGAVIGVLLALVLTTPAALRRRRRRRAAAAQSPATS
jgi:glycopeptide antibiotics resistance protein